MGWDSFGLPAENAAIERGVSPSLWTEGNVERMREQLGGMGGGFDWGRVSTVLRALPIGGYGNGVGWDGVG